MRIEDASGLYYMEAEYKVVYDAMREVIPLELFFIPIAIGAAIVGIVQHLRAAVKELPHPAAIYRTVLSIIVLCGFLIGGSLGIVNIFAQQITCVNWLRTGQYIVTEGQVENFHHPFAAGEKRDVFTLGQYTFTYSDYDLTHGCFRNTRARGGPIYEGRPVRIAHNQGIILRIEVLDK